MHSKDSSFRLFLQEAPRIFGDLAVELDSELITLEPGLYEIEKGGFCLRVYYTPGPNCSVDFGPIRLKSFPKNRPGGPIGIEYIASAFGQVYRNKEYYVAGKITKARDAARTYCLPIMMGDVSGWESIVAYVNQKWVLFLQAKAHPQRK
jgi:hypothetical protein